MLPRALRLTLSIAAACSSTSASSPPPPTQQEPSFSRLFDDGGYMATLYAQTTDGVFYDCFYDAVLDLPAGCAGPLQVPSDIVSISSDFLGTRYAAARADGSVMALLCDDNGSGGYVCDNPWFTVTGVSGIVSVHDQCGIADDGRVECWGNASAPGPFPEPPKRFAGGLVIAASGNLYTMGGTQIAISDTIDATTAPLDDGNTSCAVKSDSTLLCWGSNAHGSVGDGTTTPRPLPVAIGTGYVAVEAAVSAAVCAITTDETVDCWGSIVSTSDGQVADVTQPTQVKGLSGVKQIAFARSEGLAALLESGDIAAVRFPLGSPEIRIVKPKH